MCFIFELWYNFTTMEWSFFSQTDPLFFHKKQPHHWRIASLNRLSFILVFYFSIFLYSSKISDILSMLYRGMFVIQSCCLKSDMDVLTAYFGLYLSQKAFRHLAYKFSHIFGLSRFFCVAYPKFCHFLFFCGTFSTYVNLLCHIFLL